jgi:KAP family P-loop domain.
MTTQTKYPIFLKNSPIGKDQFEGKSQQTIATSIAEQLKANSCKMIGIDGGWGTGKSNLVMIVENILKAEVSNNNKNFHFFTYDAWGHQEDVQRRAILEELTEELTSKHPKFESDKWKDKLKNLLAKNKETNTTAKPSLSIGIIISVLVVVLTPILKIITEKVENPYLKTIIVAIPLLFLIVVFFRTLYKLPKETTTRKERYKLALQKLFEIYQKDKIEKTTYETISEEEPSVKKFRDWMKEIEKDLGDDRLVLVFDNLDRLPQIKVQELWSSIHVFFAETDYTNINVIVPFDRAHIRSAFKENGEQDCYGDDFINKTFSVIYRVSLPILSNWKNYFKEKWKDAFGEIDPELKLVLQIYDGLTETITPRGIIAFINEFVSIKILTKNSIPNRYIALFILGKKEILESPLSEIITPSYLKGLSFIYNDDEDMQKCITALTYQIPVDNALQIVYSKKLQDALSNSDTESVELISQTKEFEDILLSIIPDITNIENAILMLDKVNSEAYKTEGMEQDVWELIYRRSKEVKNNTQKLKKIQKVLLDKVTDKVGYTKSIISEMTDSNKQFKASDYYNSINDLENQIKENEYNIDIFQELKFKSTETEDFISFVKIAKHSYTNYKITTDENLLDEFLSSKSIDELKEINYVPYIKDDYELSLYKHKIEEYIQSNSNNLEYFKLLTKRYKEVNDKFDIEIPDSTIYNHFNSLTKNDDFYFDLLAMRIAKQDSFHPSYTSIFNSILSSNDENDAQKLTDKIRFYYDYSDFLVGLKLYSGHPLYCKVAKNLTENYTKSQRANILDILKNFQFICNSAEISPKALISKLNGWPHTRVNIDNVKDNVSLDVINETLDVENTLIDHIRNILAEYLDSISEDQWKDYFKSSNCYEINMALLLNYKWNSNAINAFKFTLKEIALGNISVPSKGKWTKIVKSIENSGRRLVAAFNDVRDTFNSYSEMDVPLFKFFGEWLFEYSSLDKKQESLRKILPPHLLNDEYCRDLILKNHEKLPEIVSKAGEDEASDFKEALKELAISSQDESIKNIAIELGIEFPKDEQLETESESM